MTFTVVIADDDTDIRSLVTIAIGKAHLKMIASVGDGAAALAAIRELRPDLAILDVAMPEMSGLDVCRAVRADPGMSDLRILLLSASVDQESQQIGLDAGADYFLAKPFSPRQLTTWLAVGKEPR